MTEVAILLPLVPILVAAAVAGLRAPVGLLAMYAALVPIGAVVALPLPLPEPFDTLSSATGAAATAGLLAHLAVRRRRSRPLPAPVPVWLLLVGLSGASVAWSINPEATVGDLLLLVGLVALFATSALLDLDQAALRRLEFGIVAGGVIAGGYALYQLAAGELPLSGAGIPRFITAAGGGETGDPNITAAGMVLPLSVAVAHALRRDARWRGAMVGAALVCGAGIVLTLSRGGLLGVLTALAVLALRSPYRAAASAVVAVPVVMLVVGLLTVPDALVARLTQQSATGRTEIWMVGLEACPRYCVAGSGLGTFPDVHERAVLDEPAAGGRRLRFEAHSLWLGTLVETGIVGLVLLVTALMLHARALLTMERRQSAAALAALAALAVMNVFLANLEFKYFWLVLIYATLTGAASQAPAAAITPAPVRPKGFADVRTAH